MNDFNTAKGIRTNKAALFWMGTSIVLLILLIIVAVWNPFAKASAASETIVTVNGEKITKDQLYDEMYTQGGNALIEGLINKELIRQEAKAKKISVTDEDIEAELERQAANFDMSVEEMMTMFEIYGFSAERLRSEMESQAMLRKLLAEEIKVSDEDIQQYYNENQAQFTLPEQVRASHILVETEEEAQEILSELNRGVDFAALAEERSLDTASAVNGGDLDYFPRGRMVEEFEEAAFSMDIGEITKEPVQTVHGYHIIKKTDHQEERIQPLDEVKDQIKNLLEDEQLYTLSTEWIQEKRMQAVVEYANE